MKCKSSFVAVLAASAAQACQHELHNPEAFADLHRSLQKRQESVSLSLDANEAILSNSFDNSSIETWSYYYTHGLHWAGTNKSMAQWTVDRWNENGFDASLAEYCKCYIDVLIDSTRR